MANLFVIFPGFSPEICDRMSIDELMRWHAHALERHKAKG